MIRTTFALALAITLASCGTMPKIDAALDDFNHSIDALGSAPMVMPVPKSEPVKQVCIPLQPWSDADRKALAAALEPVASDSLIVRMAIDWERMREDAKACQDARQ